MKKINFIAELCQNHLGKTKNVEKMLAQCAYYGAKTVKLQYIYAKNISFRPRFENGIFVKKKKYSIKRPYADEYERLKKLELPEKNFEKFVKLCEKHSITPMVTCFAREHVDKIYNHGFKHVKVASYDCSSFQLIRGLCKKFKNIVVSTGATYDDEIKLSSEILKKNKINYALLHCVTIYPTPFKLLNLSRLNFLKKFTSEIGYSDHTPSFGHNKNLASLAAVYLGAKYVERHIRIYDQKHSKDGPVSILPSEISEIVMFSKLSNKEKKEYIFKKYKFNLKSLLGQKKRTLSEIELLNRDYYKGRFSSKINNATRDIYNWEEIKI